MRALIRAYIREHKALPNREDAREDYDNALIKLFQEIGYDARRLSGRQDRLPTQDELRDSKDVERLFDGVPDDLRDEETKHLIMLGYTSQGQAKFVVCSINQLVLHIRVRDDLFDKLKRACKEICVSSWNHSLT
jgi:hypothetical protein